MTDHRQQQENEEQHLALTYEVLDRVSANTATTEDVLFLQHELKLPTRKGHEHENQRN
jgi:hypothetical protein